MNKQKYLKIVKIWAIYDLVLTILLTVPFTVWIIITYFQFIDIHFNLNGDFEIFQPVHLLFVSLMWVISIFWAILRIKHINVLLGIYDAYMRIWISLVIAIYIIFYNVSLFFISFFVFELLLWLIQYYFWSKIYK